MLLRSAAIGFFFSWSVDLKFRFGERFGGRLIWFGQKFRFDFSIGGSSVALQFSNANHVFFDLCALEVKF